jgi:uncharacterized membrane protein YedE/YeeE
LFHSRFGFTSGVAAADRGRQRGGHAGLRVAAGDRGHTHRAGHGHLGGPGRIDPGSTPKPVGLSLFVGATLFAIGMQLGGACASATLFAVGSGQSAIALTLSR